MSEPTPTPEPYRIEARLVRPRVNVENVNGAALTEVPCTAVEPQGAVWFAETLCPEDELAVREWLTTRDDTELARRAWLRAVDSTDLLNGFDILRAFALGDDMPLPIYPEPDPVPEPIEP